MGGCCEVGQVTDLLFVLWFQWNVFGAAIASVIAQLFSFLFCLKQIKKIPHIQLQKSDWKLDRKMAGELFLFGLPITLQFIVIPYYQYHKRLLLSK